MFWLIPPLFFNEDFHLVLKQDFNNPDDIESTLVDCLINLKDFRKIELISLSGILKDTSSQWIGQYFSSSDVSIQSVQDEDIQSEERKMRVKWL